MALQQDEPHAVFHGTAQRGMGRRRSAEDGPLSARKSTKENRMSGDDGVLAGLKVIDCATYVAGPAAATILSDFGADVIKIERPPDGDLWRSFCSVPGYARTDFEYTWLLTSGNKCSIVLALT